MLERRDGIICRVVRTEVGSLHHASGTVIIRVEHLPLGDTDADEKPAFTTFVLDQEQALILEEQLLE